MHWQVTETTTPETPIVFDSVDLLFTIQCRTLPIDHHWDLREAIRAVLPWLQQESAAAIHAVHDAASGNGWMRPTHGIIHLSRRTRLCLRLPQRMLNAAQMLEGKQLNIAGHALAVGKSHIRPLSKHKTLFARHIRDTAERDDETGFIKAAVATLKDKQIEPPRIVSGQKHIISTPQADFTTRSIMLDGLSTAASVRLQEEGLGNQQQLGIGIFLPHKSIDAVYSAKDE